VVELRQNFTENRVEFPSGGNRSGCAAI